MPPHMAAWHNQLAKADPPSVFVFTVGTIQTPSSLKSPTVHFSLFQLFPLLLEPEVGPSSYHVVAL